MSLLPPPFQNSDAEGQSFSPATFFTNNSTQEARYTVKAGHYLPWYSGSERNSKIHQHLSQNRAVQLGVPPIWKSVEGRNSDYVSEWSDPSSSTPQWNPGSGSNYRKFGSFKSKANISFYCDACNRGFGTQEELGEHQATHIKCPFARCTFMAHPKVVALHQKLQHSSGLAEKMVCLDTPEGIRRWREERKRKRDVALFDESKRRRQTLDDSALEMPDGERWSNRAETWRDIPYHAYHRGTIQEDSIDERDRKKRLFGGYVGKDFCDLGDRSMSPNVHFSRRKPPDIGDRRKGTNEYFSEYKRLGKTFSNEYASVQRKESDYHHQNTMNEKFISDKTERHGSETKKSFRTITNKKWEGSKSMHSDEHNKHVPLKKQSVSDGFGRIPSASDASRERTNRQKSPKCGISEGPLGAKQHESDVEEITGKKSSENFTSKSMSETKKKKQVRSAQSQKSKPSTDAKDRTQTDEDDQGKIQIPVDLTKNPENALERHLHSLFQRQHEGMLPESLGHGESLLDQAIKAVQDDKHLSEGSFKSPTTSVESKATSKGPDQMFDVRPKEDHKKATNIQETFKLCPETNPATRKVLLSKTTSDPVHHQERPEIKTSKKGLLPNPKKVQNVILKKGEAYSRKQGLPPVPTQVPNSPSKSIESEAEQRFTQGLLPSTSTSDSVLLPEWLTKLLLKRGSFNSLQQRLLTTYFNSKKPSCTKLQQKQQTMVSDLSENVTEYPRPESKSGQIFDSALSDSSSNPSSSKPDREEYLFEEMLRKVLETETIEELPDRTAKDDASVIEKSDIGDPDKSYLKKIDSNTSYGSKDERNNGSVKNMKHEQGSEPEETTKEEKKECNIKEERDKKRINGKQVQDNTSVSQRQSPSDRENQCQKNSYSTVKQEEVEKRFNKDSSKGLLPLPLTQKLGRSSEALLPFPSKQQTRVSQGLLSTPSDGGLLPLPVEHKGRKSRMSDGLLPLPYDYLGSNQGLLPLPRDYTGKGRASQGLLPVPSEQENSFRGLTFLASGHEQKGNSSQGLLSLPWENQQTGSSSQGLLSLPLEYQEKTTSSRGLLSLPLVHQRKAGPSRGLLSPPFEHREGLLPLPSEHQQIIDNSRGLLPLPLEHQHKRFSSQGLLALPLEHQKKDSSSRSVSTTVKHLMNQSSSRGRMPLSLEHQEDGNSMGLLPTTLDHLEKGNSSSGLLPLPLGCREEETSRGLLYSPFEREKKGNTGGLLSLPLEPREEETSRGLLYSPFVHEEKGNSGGLLSLPLERWEEETYSPFEHEEKGNTGGLLSLPLEHREEETSRGLLYSPFEHEAKRTTSGLLSRPFQNREKRMTGGLLSPPLERQGKGRPSPGLLSFSFEDREEENYSRDNQFYNRSSSGGLLSLPYEDDKKRSSRRLLSSHLEHQERGSSSDRLLSLPFEYQKKRNSACELLSDPFKLQDQGSSSRGLLSLPFEHQEERSSRTLRTSSPFEHHEERYSSHGLLASPPERQERSSSSRGLMSTPFDYQVKRGSSRRLSPLPFEYEERGRGSGPLSPPLHRRRRGSSSRDQSEGDNKRRPPPFPSKHSKRNSYFANSLPLQKEFREKDHISRGLMTFSAKRLGKGSPSRDILTSPFERHEDRHFSGGDPFQQEEERLFSPDYYRFS